jgi:hypothetical protein
MLRGGRCFRRVLVSARGEVLDSAAASPSRRQLQAATSCASENQEAQNQIHQCVTTPYPSGYVAAVSRTHMRELNA